MQSKDYRDRLDKIKGLADRLEDLKSDFEEAAALDAGMEKHVSERLG